MEWVGEKVAHYKIEPALVLEVGSRNVNGSVRKFFKGSSYVGIDMEDGYGVDIVVRADRIPYDNGFFNVVISTEMLEHDPYFWKSIAEMERVLKPGGWMFITTRGIGFPFHEHPQDFWRFTPDAITHLFQMVDLSPVEVVEDPLPGHPGVFGLAYKNGRG